MEDIENISNIPGWEKVYEGTLDEGEGLEMPLSLKYVSVYGDWVKVFRHHTIEIDSIEITPEEDILDVEDETQIQEDLWYYITSEGDKEYHHSRPEARKAAMDRLRKMRTIDELKAQMENIEHRNREYRNV